MDALWASRTTPKDSTGMSPYLLVYGKELKMSISLELNELISVVNTEYTEDNSPIERIIDQLLNLEEERSRYMNQNSQRQ
jgi:hypothetical protein